MLVNQRLYRFAGGESGRWRVVGMSAIAGAPIEEVSRVEVLAAGETLPPAGSRWVLRGVTSNERYVARPERTELVGRQPPLERPNALYAALIAIRKSERWWIRRNARRGVRRARRRAAGDGGMALRGSRDRYPATATLTAMG